MRVEKGGKPSVLISAPPFKEEIISHSALHGIPYLPFVVVDFVQEVFVAIPAATEKAFPKMIKALTTPAKELEKHIPGEVF